MIHTMDTDASGSRPLYIRVAEERERRMRLDREAWTQDAVAKRAGVSKRTYGMFEKGQGSPQGKTLRAILRVFDMDETPEDTRDATLESWPADIGVFLDMMGAFLATMPEAERLAFMHDATRRIVGYRK